MRTQLIGAFCAGAVILLGSGAQAMIFVTPNAQASVEGNGNNTFPFGIGNDPYEVPSGTQRYQQVYSASDFAALAPGGEYITQIAFRPDATFGAAFSTTLPDIRIDLSTASASPDALSTTFANNVGADDTIVYGGATGAALSLSSSFTGPAGGPKDFDIIINLTTPFFYDPAAGNLLLDVRNFGGGSIPVFDAQDALFDSVSRVYTGFSGVGSATADHADSTGLVTRFTTVVPEPGTMLLAALGGASLFLLRQKREAENREPRVEAIDDRRRKAKGRIIVETDFIYPRG